MSEPLSAALCPEGFVRCEFDRWDRTSGLDGPLSRQLLGHERTWCEYVQTDTNVEGSGCRPFADDATGPGPPPTQEKTTGGDAAAPLHFFAECTPPRLFATAVSHPCHPTPPPTPCDQEARTSFFSFILLFHPLPGVAFDPSLSVPGPVLPPCLLSPRFPPSSHFLTSTPRSLFLPSAVPASLKVLA